jgi:hypothetical protein
VVECFVGKALVVFKNILFFSRRLQQFSPQALVSGKKNTIFFFNRNKYLWFSQPF